MRNWEKYVRSYKTDEKLVHRLGYHEFKGHRYLTNFNSVIKISPELKNVPKAKYELPIEKWFTVKYDYHDIRDVKFNFEDEFFYARETQEFKWDMRMIKYTQQLSKIKAFKALIIEYRLLLFDEDENQIAMILGVRV